jgi:uncharacterized membrane protein SpoIIM required for sporulation
MNQEQFIHAHETDWRRLESWLDGSKARDAHAAPITAEEFATLYRKACQHLALARSRLYSHYLIERLDRLVVNGHAHLYGVRRNVLRDVARYVLSGFPRQVRAEWRVVLVSAALFYGALAATGVTVALHPDLVYTVMDARQLRDIEYMYDPTHVATLGRAAGREADSDVMMFGFYVSNNTGIGFRTFASGLLFGLGTLATLLFNGVFIGAISGHLTQLGYIETFWGFVAGHSALELNAIALSGAAGLKLGGALLAPGRRTRVRALRDEARHAMGLMYGAAGMFVLAAMVEAFWSPLRILAPEVKYTVGLGLWLLVLAYFAVGGRRAAG